MQGFKEKRGLYFLCFALFGLLVAVGYKPALSFADTINTIPVATPSVFNEKDLVRDGTVKPIIRVQVYDNDRVDSVGGDIFVYNDKNEIVGKDSYAKRVNYMYNYAHDIEIPLSEVELGDQTFTVQIVSFNKDQSKQGESIVKNIKVSLKQKYTIKHIDRFTNKEITSSSAYMPKEHAAYIAEDVSTVILGLVSPVDEKTSVNYKFEKAYVGSELLERADNNATYLKFKHKMTDNPDGEVITIYYQSDVPDYFHERSELLNNELTVSEEMPVIERELTLNTSVPMQQRITLGSADSVSNKPFAKKNILGTGTAANPGSLYVNVMDEFSNGSYARSIYNSTTMTDKFSGISIYRPGNTSTTLPLYLDPNMTTYYYQKLATGEEIIKVLGVNKPTFNNKDPFDRYVVEYTLVCSPKTNDIDVTVEVTNGTGQAVDLGIMYTTVLNTKGAIAGSTVDTRGPITAVGDNQGVTIQQPGRDVKHDVENTVHFPKKEDNGPANWMIGPYNYINNYTGFNRGGESDRATGQGLENGYTLAESKNVAGDDSLVGKPYKKGFEFNTTTLSSLRMKTDVKSTQPNESVKMNWKVSFGDKKLEKNETSIYREMDKQSGETLDGFDLVGKVLPIEIDTKRIADGTEVRNFMMFGAQSSQDTLSSITNPTLPNRTGSKINIDYRKEKVGLMFPRVITYNKNFDNLVPTSYSYDYVGGSGADNPVYGGSGFGIATFQDHKVENNVPATILDSSQIDEYYVSKDGHSAKVYGMYKFGTGKEIPVKITLESANDKGKARMILEYMNTLDTKTNFNSFYTVHMDINGNHKTSQMKTLGGTKGVYFQEPSLASLKGANYYVAFYTHNTNNGTPVDNMNVYNIDDTGFTYPTNWEKVGGSETSHVPKFDPSQKKGERLKYRDTLTGEIKESYPAHPGWFFSYASQELDKNDIGRADIELKVSDLEEIIYAPVKIIPEKDKEAHTKAELTYQPIVEQEMFEKMSSEGHKADNVEIVTSFNPYIDVKEEDLTVYAGGDLLDKSLYTLTVDKQKNEFKLLFKDPVPWDLKGKKVEIKQNSKVITNETTNGIMKYYDKPTESFIFDITAYNSWDVHNDPAELREVQDPVSKEKQLIKYTPTITAEAVKGLTVNSGDSPKAASDYVTITSQPDFDFDRYEAKFKDNKPPEFKGNGDVTFIVVVESKEFGAPIEVYVTVKVVEEVNMTVKHFLKTPAGKTEKLVNLKDNDLKEIPDETKKVKVSDDFSDILKRYQSELILGYNYLETVVKVDNQIEKDHSQVPAKDFVVELYYDGKVMLDYPETFDFGSHQLSVLGKDEVRPKITKDGNTDDGEMKMQVINTQGQGGVWKLSASQTKEMTNGSDTFKGSIYYVPKPGAEAIELDNTYKKIEVDSQTNQIINRIPLLPKDLSTKAGIYIDINPGNKLGNYTDGEITWSLEDVL